MRSSDPLNTLSHALASAAAVDLPDILWEGSRGKVSRRPRRDEVDAILFPQVWPSTALGFDGVGGQAMTTAHTAVIRHGDVCAVYFGERFAYLASMRNEAFREDLRCCALADADSAGDRYALDRGVGR